MIEEKKDLSTLRVDPTNRRSHNERNLSMVTAAFTEVGAGRSIVIDEDDVILAGNGVTVAAQRAGVTRVRIIDTDGTEVIAVRRRGLTPLQKRALAMYDNRSAELSEWNWDQLADDQRNGLTLTPWFTTEELADGFGITARPGRTDPDAVPEIRATDIQAGDLFELGTHRLLCGDSTDPTHVTTLLGGRVPRLMVTDPPYGVDYDPAWRARAGVNRSTKKLGTVTHDDTADWRAAWVGFPGCIAYVWHAGLKASIVENSLLATGFELRSQIVWVKDRMALSRGDYHWQHEPCWYAVRRGEPGHRTDDRSQTTVWNIPAREDAGHTHGTQKPVECMARPMRNHEPCDVYDPFVGSGTTLIAGEQFGRTCFVIELAPPYCQVAIDRWEAFTGQRAAKVGDARP